MKLVRIAIVLLFIGFITGCASISLYDQYSYIQTISLKVDALYLMDKAVEDAELYKNEIESLKINIDKMYEYEKGRADNEISTAMWSFIKDPEKHMLGGFLQRWQSEKILKQVYIAEAKKLITKGFDLISELESGKIKPAEAGNSLNGIYKLK